MKKIALALALVSLGAAALGCSDDNRDSLGGVGGSSDPNGTGGATGGEHMNNPNAADPQSNYNASDPAAKQAEDAIVGSPEVGARLHSCGKITYAALGNLLTSRGVNVGSATANSAGLVYRNGMAALGTANYQGRVPEAPFYSTSAMSKQMDIFAQAAAEIAATGWNPPGCTGVKMFSGADFTKEGISCIIGKPARDEHVALANQAIKQAETPEIGKQIAISALLSAAHTCE